jgi:hypothetical protein
MPLPNFLIVGAAKAGTTSLSTYLGAHPNVFVSTPSEPKFLTSEFLEFPHQGPGDAEIDAGVVRDLQSYRQLFAGTEDVEARGEASADLLYYHRRSIPVVKDLLGDPKIIAILRDPVERAFSAYKFLVGLGRETRSFGEALAAEPRRLEENWEFIWAYRGASLYAQAVEAYQDAFSNVLVLLLDDLKRQPRKTVESALKFLGVRAVVATDVNKVHNESRAPRSAQLAELRAAQSGGVANVLNIGRTLAPEGVKQFVRQQLDRWNDQGPTMGSIQRQRLAASFRKDVKQLERVIDRDLNSWSTNSHLQAILSHLQFPLRNGWTSDDVN